MRFSGANRSRLRRETNERFENVSIDPIGKRAVNRDH